MYKIPYKMVEIATDSGEILTLEDVLKSLSNVPMSLLRCQIIFMVYVFGKIVSLSRNW